MELGRLGAVFALTVEIEGQSAKFYGEAASLTRTAPAQQVFLALAEASEKRKSLLERSRRENINEMLLEPIVGLTAYDYLVDLRLSSQMDCQDILRIAMELEEKRQRLYLDASRKIGLPEVARVLERLGAQNADHRLRLQSLHHKGSP